MRLIPIHPDNLNQAWKDVEKYVARGIEYTDGKYSVESIKEAILGQNLILWVVYNDEEKRAQGCVLTEIYDYPLKRCLMIFLLAGDGFDKIVTLLPDLMEYGKGRGCTSLEFYGRSGWEKVLKAHNFEKIHTVMRLKI